MTLNEIKLAIRNGNFSNEDLITLGSYIQNVKTEQAKASISVGDEVFVVQKTKKTKGIVEKINIKKAIVTLPHGRYNVPLSMLEAV